MLNPDPEAVIPWVATVPGEDPERWERAAELEIFTTDGTSQNRQISVSTRLYLAHDGTLLYALWECVDPEGVPEVPTRGARSDLTLDESVQLVLGIPGEGIRTDMQMGGYDGAQGVELAPVKHDYEFTVNAAASKSRAYDETPLAQARFDATVTPTASGYRVRMEIPLASAGITVDGETELYGNAFRFYRATRYGWFLPAFGNYAAMPFGRWRLAASGSTAPGKREQATVELANATAVPPVPARLEDAALSYYPLARELCAVFPADSRARRVFLRCGEAEVTAQLSPERAVTLRLPVPDLPKDQPHEALAGWEGGEKRLTFTPLSAPDWYGTTAGSEYLAEKVPAPWRKPEWDGKAIHLHHATLDFAAGALPRQMVVNGRSLLAAPVRIEAETLAGKRLGTEAAVPRATVGATRVDLHGAPGAGIEVRNVVDYDGFMVVRMRFPETDAREISRLEVTVPLAPGVVKYLNRGLVQTTAILGEAVYRGNGGDIWVGNESFGVSISGDRNYYFSPRDGRQVELRPRADGGSELVLHLVTGAGQLTERAPVIQFFLLPTPTREQAPLPEENRMKLLFEEWTDYQGYPDMTKVPLVREKAAAAHAAGARQYLYFSQCIAENAPEAELWSIEWFAPPDRPWYRRSYEPGKGVACHVSCFRGAAGDLLLDRIAQLREQCGIDGVYLDGTANPFDCANPSHACDESLPVLFDDNADRGRILGHRAFLKRLRGIFDAAGCENPLWVHTGGALDLPTLSLADYLYEGEQLARYHQGYMLEPEKFMIGYSGRAFGFRSLFLPMIFSDAGGIDRALAWGLVHDVETSLGGNPHYRSSVQERFFELPRLDAEARFYPYWEEQPQIRRVEETPLLISYYAGNAGAMLVAANLRYEGAQEAVLELSGLLRDGWTVTELTAPEKVRLEHDTTLRVTVPEGGFRLFAIGPKSGGAMMENPSTAAAAVNFPATWRWELRSGNREEPAESGVEGGLAFSGVSGMPEARAELLATLPEEFELRFPFRHYDCFRIRLNDIALEFNSWDGWKATGLMPGDYQGRCYAYGRWLNGGFDQATGRDITLTVTAEAGRISLFYGDILLLDRVLPANSGNGWRVALETWSDQKLLLGAPELSREVTVEAVEPLHPVR